MTVLHDFGGVLEWPLDTSFWAQHSMSVCSHLAETSQMVVTIRCTFVQLLFEHHSKVIGLTLRTMLRRASKPLRLVALLGLVKQVASSFIRFPLRIIKSEGLESDMSKVHTNVSRSKWVLKWEITVSKNMHEGKEGGGGVSS